MDIAVYRCKSGQLLLVPHCCLPSLTAEKDHGPLTTCGTTHLVDHYAAEVEPPRPWRIVMQSLQRDTFAVISAEDGVALLGPGHPCLQGWPRPTGERRGQRLSKKSGVTMRHAPSGRGAG